MTTHTFNTQTTTTPDPAAPGHFNGFGNLVMRESRKWWGTRRWWMQLLIWLVLLNGFVVFGLFVMPGIMEQSTAQMSQAEASGAEVMTAAEFQQDVPNLFFGLATFFLPVGVIVLVQGQVYAEKRSGVAAWILSKPVSRPVYLLAKLITDSIGIILFMVIVPVTCAYLLIASVIEVNIVHFLTAAGLLTMMLLFYQAFTLMMSVIGNSTEVVVGISLGLLLGGMILKDVIAQAIGELVFLTPWILPDAIAVTLSEHPLPAPMHTTLIAVPLITLLCLMVMFWQFGRQEL